MHSEDIDAEEEVEFEDFAASCPHFDNIINGLQNFRRKDIPILPKLRAIIQLDGIDIKTLYKTDEGTFKAAPEPGLPDLYTFVYK